MSFVRTVLGDVAPSDLGTVDYHEHLFQVSPLLAGDELNDEAASGAEAELLHSAGIWAMIDATPIGLCRNPEAVARISARTGLRVVAATGAHREAHYPEGHWLRSLERTELAALFIRDLVDGCPRNDEDARTAAATSAAGMAIRAGLIKAGIGYWSISGFEHRVLQAAAEAHRRTGAPVMVHLEHGSAAHEVLDLLAAAGVAPNRIVLAHADRNPDVGLHLELIRRGVYLGYDGMARTRGRTDEEILELIERVTASGGSRRLLLGGDVARRTRYIAYGGMPGLAYLPERFLPRLRDRIGNDQLELLMVANPGRFLAWTAAE